MICKPLAQLMGISIHAPREGGDLMVDSVDGLKRDFNPRPPRGGRLGLSCASGINSSFQSTPPARGATAHNRGIL